MFGPLVVALSLLPVGQAFADTAREGQYRHQACYVGPQQVLSLSKDQLGGSYWVNGASLAEKEDFFGNLVASCVGSWSVINGDFGDSGVCEYTDSAGDKFFGVYSRRNADLGTWRTTGGTGKYAGMVMSGQYKPMPQLAQPAGQFVGCSVQWGAWKVR